jgi:hypothetical protein
LLLAEAPPWSENGNVNYFYNPSTPASNFMQSITKAFFGEFIHKDKSIGYEGALKALAEKGFLICDSIPFAIDYSNGSKRGNKYYQQLINLTVNSNLMNKLNSNGLRYSLELKVAFSLKVNAKAVSKAMNASLNLSAHSQVIDLDESMIAVNGANYLSHVEMMRIYEL